ncbi:SCO5389 family protein [Actinoplanes sp. NPDC051475]|uniref:SCO5389 family protein n=1 Tax=Actinoplanes sp. NPDC051475 TaxID=3157225 RepID=UPI00344CD892
MSLNVSPDLLAVAERGEVSDAEFVDCEVPPPSETERGQLLRALASDAIRGGLERHFGARLAFQNCHRVAAFRFVRWGQLLNPSPELRNC